MFRQVAVAAVALLALVARGEAAPISIIDQQSTTVTGGVNILVIGQSFTPTLDHVDAFEFMLRSSFAASTTIRLDLIAGHGFGGALLASSVEVTISQPLQWVHFDLSADLTPGESYTARLVRTAGDPFLVQYADIPGGTPYLGGDLHTASGLVLTTSDLVYREGVHAASVAEPLSLALVGTGLAGLALTRRRRT